jgi:2-keto-3-deoxy-L-fuconate dehydrogenase
MRSDIGAVGSPLVDLTDVAMLVTGGSAGIGAAIVSTARRLGARVGVVDLRAPEEPGIPYAEADVSSWTEASTAVAEVATELNGLDVLVNNAGIAPAGRFEDISEERWRETLGVNLDGAFFCTRASLPHLRDSTAPAVVNMASVAARSFSRTASVAYAASKGGVVALTRQLAHELATEGLRVNCVCPGLVDTAVMGRNVSPQRLAELVQTIPLGRLASPAEVAAVVCFLGSAAAGYLTGTVVDVNGGMA